MSEPRTYRAIMACAEWLVACLKLGWDKSELDGLEALWWRHHDHRGALIPFARHTVGCASRRTHPAAGACDCGVAGEGGETRLEGECESRGL